MKAIPLALLLMSTCFQVQISQSLSEGIQDRTTEIADLLRRLYPSETQSAVNAPGPGARQNVESRLLSIAEQSSEGRAEVIEALINIVKDHEARKGWPVASRWILAVDLLGYLRATEAIGVLINNLDHTGENGIHSSIHYQPVGNALRNIGRPAVPGLIQALGSDNEEIHIQAAYTLAKIGNLALPNLLDALSGNQPSIKSRVAQILTWIGGQEAKQAIERAIEIEENEMIIGKLEEALIQFNSRWRDRK